MLAQRRRACAGYELMVETWRPAERGQVGNAVLVCHALNASPPRGRHRRPTTRKSEGWWDNLVGPGKPLDTRPLLRHRRQQPGLLLRLDRPDAAEPGHRPAPTARCSPSSRCEDWVDAQARVLDRFGITQLAAVLGGSLAACRRWPGSLRYPDRLRHCIAVATAPNLSAQNIAFNEVARRAIVTDPDFHGGYFYAHGVVPQARPARGAHDRPHHLPERRRRWPRSSAARCARRAEVLAPRTSSSRSRATCATRATSSASTSTPTPTC